MQDKNRKKILRETQEQIKERGKGLWERIIREGRSWTLDHTLIKPTAVPPTIFSSSWGAD